MVALQDAWLRAWRFAAQVHNAQRYPGTELPYLTHLGAVAMEVLVAHQLAPLFKPELALQCALLHDTLEDTPTTEAELLALFGPEVTAGVAALTKNASLPKDEAMADSLRRIRQQPREVWVVKLADRIANLEGQPPPHWDADRTQAYRREAERILSELGAAHDALAQRLLQKIERYPRARRG